MAADLFLVFAGWIVFPQIGWRLGVSHFFRGLYCVKSLLELNRSSFLAFSVIVLCGPYIPDGWLDEVSQVGDVSLGFLQSPDLCSTPPRTHLEGWLQYPLVCPYFWHLWHCGISFLLFGSSVLIILFKVW